MLSPQLTMESLFQFNFWEKPEIPQPTAMSPPMVSPTLLDLLAKESEPFGVTNQATAAATEFPSSPILPSKRKLGVDEIEPPQRKRLKIVGKRIKFLCDQCGLRCQEIKNLKMLQELYPEYGKGFYCDECNLGSPTWPMFHCPKENCEYDVCMSCALTLFNNTYEEIPAEVETPSSLEDREDIRLNLLDEDDFLKQPVPQQLEPILVKKEEIKPEPQPPTPPIPKKEPKYQSKPDPSKFRLVFAQPALNPVGVLPRFDMKKRRKRSFSRIKRQILMNKKNYGRGKGKKPMLPPVKSDKGGNFTPPQYGKYSRMAFLEDTFVWKTGKEWLAYWPCFEKPFDDVEFAELHDLFMEERVSVTFETSSRGRVTKRTRTEPPVINADTEAELYEKYSMANQELALILLRVYRTWLTKPHICPGHKPWVQTETADSSDVQFLKSRAKEVVDLTKIKFNNTRCDPIVML